MRAISSRIAVLAIPPLCLLVFSTPANGQFYVDNSASTVGESYARGMSDMVRSAGAANLSNSQAAKNYEDARSQNLDNRLQATDTYFQMRAKNKAYRAAENGPRPTSEELFRIAKEKAPKRLSPSDLDPISGSITWPMALRDQQFLATKQRIEAMVKYWAEHNHQLTLSQFEQLNATIDQLTEELKLVVKAVPANIYAESRHFLESLAYEIQISDG